MELVESLSALEAMDASMIEPKSGSLRAI
jgi:hypothetical protein